MSFRAVRATRIFMNTAKTNPVAEIENLLEDEIRRRAHKHWLQNGSQPGDDWTHWFAAKKQLQENLSTLGAATTRDDFPGGGAPKKGSASGQHFHERGERPDHRTEVASSGAIQRRRARHAPRDDRPSAPATEKG